MDPHPVAPSDPGDPEPAAAGGDDRRSGAVSWRFHGRALGSRVLLECRVPAAGPVAGAVAAAAWDAVRDEFEAVDRALSRFRDDSELTALNRLAGSGTTVSVSWRLRTMLAAVHRAGRLTGGRFDAGVLGDLERIGEAGARLDAGRGAHGAAEVAAGAERTRLAPPGADRVSAVVVPAKPVDSGGIGKGLALRWAAARALRVLVGGPAAERTGAPGSGGAVAGAADAPGPGAAPGLLLDAGGDVVVAGTPPAFGWRIGIEDPAGTGGTGPIAVVRLDRGAVATSSVRVRAWTSPDGSAVHHLIDPASRAPARTGLVAVTVASDDPAWAEVRTKELFLAGRGGIAEEARAAGLAAWWVDVDGRLGLTPAARERSVWVAEERIG